MKIVIDKKELDMQEIEGLFIFEVDPSDTLVFQTDHLLIDIKD